MASSALTKARNELVRLNDKRKRLARDKKDELETMYAGASTLAGGAAAGLVDNKFGEGGAVATVLDGKVPVNAAVATGAMLAAAFGKGLPGRRYIGAFGTGVGAAALYQYVRENVDFE